MEVINKCILAWLVLLVGAMPEDCLAQQKKVAPVNQRAQFYFDKPITLDSLTRYVHRHSTIRFSFNSSKVKGDKVINLKKGSYTIGLLLQEIRRNTSLYYLRYNGYVIFQDNPPKQKAGVHPVAKKKAPHPPPPKTTPLVTVRPTRPADTDTIQRIIAANPDLLNRVIAVKSSKPADTVYQKVKDTMGLYLGRNGHYRATGDGDNRQLQPGRGLMGPVVLDSLNNHRWVKDTMPAKTITIHTATSKKEARAIVRSARSAGYTHYGQPGGGWYWQFGLYWKVAVPLQGSRYYFTGPNNRTQPWNPLIPGLWLSRRSNRHEVLLLVKPAEWALYGNKVMKADTSYSRFGPDTFPAYVQVRKTTGFIKSGGMYAGVQYNYHVNNYLVIGAGIGYQTLGQTLVLQQTKRLLDTGAYGKTFPDTLYTAKGDSLTGKYGRSSLIQARFEVAYKAGAADVGAAVLLPLTSAFTSQSSGQGMPLHVQVFVRWRLKRKEEP